MADKKHILTYAGLKKYEDELQDLKVNRRREIAQKIKEAREQGDLSENAEYDAAKDEQRDIEARIEQIEQILKNAEVVDEDEVDLDVVNIGCLVRVDDIEYNEEEEIKKIRASERRGGYDDGWSAGNEAGRIEGEAIGKLEERKRVILEILEQKGKITEALKEKIQNQNDMAILKDWLQEACTIESIEEFESNS